MDLRSLAKSVPDGNACVVVIDDDPDFRESLGRLLRSVGLRPQLFGSIADFLASEPPQSPTCLGHRSNMMRKIQAASLAELCRMADKLKLLPERSERA